ncbi:uncharacterized protein MYCFIDRAFT_169724 [Pseudocercospora fijiensis CIRAD86]|uniref:Uncharacterized protein n=1 Tax=Pseudocercospora fijiensis (strain CIRAD86) TaxID=383855 RepID=N1Q884_PSEFD|nr:uncharacterized protein MYCFIDRAFT_169724 [Pseudocercospora fijiensis CIRAD86]EME88006.1 hypothetical protein MYCFIDRAFT_169724 [Pseudocercospora fijiensis CIRAD86]
MREYTARNCFIIRRAASTEKEKHIFVGFCRACIQHGDVHLLRLSRRHGSDAIPCENSSPSGSGDSDCTNRSDLSRISSDLTKEFVKGIGPKSCCEFFRLRDEYAPRYSNLPETPALDPPKHMTRVLSSQS